MRIYGTLKTIVVILFCALSVTVNAQVADTAKKNLGDTLKKDLFTAPDSVKKLHSNPLSLIPPIALIAYGASSFVITPVRNFDYYIHGRIERSAPNFNSKAESYFLFAPIVIVYGLNLVGVEGKNRFVDRTALLGLSGLFLGVSELSLKHATHRLRPNEADIILSRPAIPGPLFSVPNFWRRNILKSHSLTRPSGTHLPLGQGYSGCITATTGLAMW